MRGAVAVAELLYRGVNRLRRALYRLGVLRARRLPRRVISVGNIAAGGAGKTPCVIAIARHLTSLGLRVAVLTRGYGRRGPGGRVTSLDAVRFGDEPVLIKKRVPEAEVVVGSNRYQNGLMISCDVYLLDDGFQHLQLHRDLDVVIDVPDPAFRREGRSALRDADVVIPRRLRLAVPDGLRGKRVAAFAGLADDEQFFRSLRDAGLDLVATFAFPDHHVYTEDDLAAVRRSDADVIVTTEKDIVKLHDGADVIAIPAEFVIDGAVLQRIAATAAGGVKK